MKNLHPDIIVNSTGSSPLLPPIKGLHDVIDREGGKVSSILNMIQLNECFDSGETEIMNIGDSVRARRIIEGTEEARNILNVLDKRDFL